MTGYKSRFDTILDQYLDHREAAHGFSDPAEYSPDGCEICDRLNRALDEAEREAMTR